MERGRYLRVKSQLTNKTSNHLMDVDLLGTPLIVRTDADCTYRRGLYVQTRIVRTDADCTYRRGLYVQTRIVRTDADCTYRRGLYVQTRIVRTDADCTYRRGLYVQTRIVRTDADCTYRRGLYVQTRIVRTDADCTYRRGLYVQTRIVRTDADCTYRRGLYVQTRIVRTDADCTYRRGLYVQTRIVRTDADCTYRRGLYVQTRIDSVDEQEYWIMTEQEAAALVVKITQIWVPERMNGGFLQWGLKDEEFYFCADIEKHIRFVRARAYKRSGHRFSIQRIQGNYATGGLSWHSEDNLISMTIFDGSLAKSCEQFAVEWMPLFRRNCWLSGCSIEATAQEQIEWMFWLREKKGELNLSSS